METKHKYIYRESDQKEIDEYAKRMKNCPVYFQVSYSEKVIVDFINKVIYDILYGEDFEVNDKRDLKNFLIKYKHDILSD